MFKTIMNYKNRQIIINEYMDEELFKRNGFFFKEIIITDHKMYVYKDEQLLYELAIPNRLHFRKDGSFPNYFVMEWETFRTEIYFP
ncbi:hypothetical protein [Neobacillus sp. D3-1R]|uniref:hypothetical protein n=1 Tax=Neobacillus sp. D3-1R TaxID=3445778 RepID=UPI003FA02BC0